MTKLNLYKGTELIKSVEKTEGKTTVTIEGLEANTDYPAGTYQVSFSNTSGESEKVDVPQFKTNAIGVASVTLDVESLDLTIGDTHQLQATVAPSNASYKAVRFTSSDDAIATVDGDGLVTAVKAGTADITVESLMDGSKTAKCAVTVKEPIPEAPTDVTVDPGETTADITV